MLHTAVPEHDFAVACIDLTACSDCNLLHVLSPAGLSNRYVGTVYHTLKTTSADPAIHNVEHLE